MARSPSSERELRRQPSYHLPFVSFAHLYGAWPERASFSLPFCPIFPRYGARPEGAFLSLILCNLPPLWRAARPRSKRSVGGQVIICLLFLLLTFMARGPSGPAFHCLSAQLWRAAQAGQLIIAFLLNLPPSWRAASPRSERSVGSPVIICLCFIFPP